MSLFSNRRGLEEAHHDSICGESTLKGAQSGVSIAEDPMLVFDIGGSHVSAAAYHRSACRLGQVVSSPHPEALVDAFLDLLYRLGVEALGEIPFAAGAILAVPGPFDHGAGKSLMRHKLSFLYGIDLRRAISDRFGWERDQVRFLKDADACLLGEIQTGAARGFNRAVEFTLGTGIGSSFAVNGRIVSDDSDVPKEGEIWNQPYAGGIVEDFVSTRAIQSTYERLTGRRCEVVKLAADATADEAAKQAFEEFGRHLGRVIQELSLTFMPEVFVLGGGISRSAHLFLPAVQREFRGRPLQLRISELQDLAPLIGCGALSPGGAANSIHTDRI
jgi:glucokinase